MASMGFPALAIQPPQSPAQEIGQVLAVKNAVQQNEMGQVQLDQARAAQQSQQTLMALYAKNNGDLNQTYADATASGQVLPDQLLDFRTKGIAAQTQMATLQEKDLTNLDKVHDMAANALEAVKAVPEAQRPDEIKKQFGTLVSQGVNPNALLPALNSLPDYSDASINRLETTFKGQQWLVDNELKQRQLASTPTPEQAQAKTAAELDQAQTNALLAHQNLLNLPTPEEAKTKRMADLRETMARTAQAQADTAEKVAQTQLIGAQPVFAFDPATNTRVLTTMPQAGSKGYTNPVKASEGDINKETELTRQFNDVQMNLSRFRLAVNNPNLQFSENGLFSAKDTSKIASILSDTKLLSDGKLISLGSVPGAERFSDIFSQTKNAQYWNELSPEQQDVVIGYLRTKGATIAYQKALAQTGRTSKEALDVEWQNLPSPIEAQGPANKSLDAFQENINVATKGIVKVPWLPSTAEVRQQIEQSPAALQSQRPAVQNPGSGQYRNAQGNQMRVGQDAYDASTKRYLGSVSRVYPDGSYDVTPGG